MPKMSPGMFSAAVGPRSETSSQTGSDSETSSIEEMLTGQSVNSIMRQRVRGVPGFSDSDDFLEPKVLHHPIRQIFKLPSRAALSIVIVLAALLSSVLTFVYPMLTWQSVNMETVVDFQASLDEQGTELHRLVHDASVASYHELLVNIEWSIWWFVTEQPSKAVQALYSSLKLEPGWQQETGKIALAEQAILTTQYWVNSPAFSMDKVVSGVSVGAATNLCAAYCDGFMVCALRAARGTSDWRVVQAPPYPTPGRGTTVSIFKSSPTGPLSLNQTVAEFFPTETREYQQQAHTRDPENSSSDAWTGIYPFSMQEALAASGVKNLAKCGYGRTLPIPRCIGCGRSCGVIFSHIPLTHAYSACQENWHLIRDRLAHSVYNYPLTPHESSVFLLVQESFARPDQVGYLVAASNSDYAADCNLQPATDFGIPVVNKAARALALRFNGDWKAEELTQKHFYMNFTAEGLDTGQWKPCKNMADAFHCFGLGTRRINLDDGLAWLAVVVLPWGAFTNGTLQQQRLIEERVRERMGAIQAARANTWRKAALLVCTAVFFVLSAGWIISTVAVRSLDRLLDYLRKLAVLDFHGLPGLDKSIELRLSPLREVAELQLGFLNLARSVECFARFVPETVVRRILRGDRNSTTINVRKRQVTIMFSDIRGFTSISEVLSQEDLLTLLYLYLSEMTKIVERMGGVVSEILGDGLLVLWNTPDDLQDHNVAACSAAIAQQKVLPKLNATFAGLGLPSVAIRIGIHTGDVLAGNIGSNKKMKYGCMGDPINLASRLEGLAKHYGVGILCSDATRMTLPNTFLCRKLDLVKVKGKEEAVWVYELIDEVAGPADDHPQSRRLQLYHDALEAFHRRDFVKAIRLANAYLAQEPQDLASQRLIERAEDALKLPPTASWSPVLEMTEK